MSAYCSQDIHGGFYAVRYPRRESPIAAEIDSNLLSIISEIVVFRLHLRRRKRTSWDDTRSLCILGRVENTW
jgi:hypothetical protein